MPRRLPALVGDPECCLGSCEVRPPFHCLCLQFPPSTKNFQEAQSQLNQAAAGLNQSANELVQASRGTPQDLAKASGKFGQDFNEFLQAGVEMAGQSPVSTSGGGGYSLEPAVSRQQLSWLLWRTAEGVHWCPVAEDAGASLSSGARERPSFALGMAEASMTWHHG